MRALVIGYGSIGKRHADLLSNNQEFDGIDVYVLTSQQISSAKRIATLEEIPDLAPDYVVIASPTTQHYDQLRFVDENLTGRLILVEKPLFDREAEFSSENNKIFVGYNLRFHPLIQKIKKTIEGRDLWSLHVICASFLPSWRPGRDYRETSSANKAAGGGVLLDLSHELDYLKWLAGNFSVCSAISGKVSNLEIDSDDILLLSGRTERGAYVQVNLNYFSRRPIRRLSIDGDGISVQADLIGNTLDIVEDEQESNYSWPDLKRNFSYLQQHRAILSRDPLTACTLEEGLSTMRIIEDIRLNHRK